MDDLATVWCEWAEMELRHKNFKRALDLMRRATVPPVRAGPRRSQEEMQGPVQGRLYRRCALTNVNVQFVLSRSARPWHCSTTRHVHMLEMIRSLIITR